VLVTGVPGSGKSTLARQLAARLRVPFLARDDVRGGLLFSAGAWTDELEHVPSGDEAVEVFLETVEGLLSRGVSCVLEYVVRSHRPGELERILDAGDCVVIMTSCEDPTARVVQRNQADRLISNPAVLAATGFDSVDAHTAATLKRMRLVEAEMMTRFPVPVLHVDTTADQDPDIDTIIEFVTAVPGAGPSGGAG
jgi:hypothetical protein